MNAPPPFFKFFHIRHTGFSKKFVWSLSRKLNRTNFFGQPNSWKLRVLAYKTKNVQIKKKKCYRYHYLLI